ncbi:hypothetical protein NW757_009846 [Fusarium falciforme]|nr:hypothetical protein NW757_009846 [Fusarium falciforme]
MERASQSQPDAIAEGRRIYIGNLPYEAKPYDVEEVLSSNGFGNLDKIHISIDPVSARNPGYCFVDFPDRETAQSALDSLSATIRGRSIKVGPCEPKKPRRNFGDEPATSRRWGDWRTKPDEGGVPIGQLNNKGEEKGPYWAMDHFDDAIRSEEVRRLYVGGLGKMIDQAQHQREITEIFTGFNPTAIGKRITPHESTRAQPGRHHYCFVDFETKEEALAAADALNGTTTTGGPLKVSLAEKTPAKLVARHPDRRNGRRVYDRAYARPGNTGSEDATEASNAMASNNWRRRD